MKEILSLFHHIHHEKDRHEAHHCGGKHLGLDYEIKHCSCGKHSINREWAIGHSLNQELESIEIKVKFPERCPNGGWHIESGAKN